MALRQRPAAATARESRGSNEVPAAYGNGKVVPLREAKSKSPNSPNGMAVLLLLAMYLCAIAGIAFHAMLRIPTPLLESAPADRFSEGRAMQLVEVLAGQIGIRPVGSDNYLKAAAYIRAQLEEIASIAGEHLRIDIDEQRASGGYSLNFLTHNMAMEYENVTNLVLRISAKDADPDAKAVLMNAHFDSQVGSPGASDCAQCVGVGLEIARLFAASPEPPLAPLIFLFNGAEETFLMGAHGFHTAHKWRKTVGAVINVESTGAGGPDVVFQAAGRDLWPVREYARAAPYPRASVIAQDFFDAHVIPGDTDFRIFAQDFGRIPGIDVVSLLDGHAYHSTQDTPDRIRRGTVQAMGDNMYALMLALSWAPELNAPPEDLPKQLQAVYWDFLGYVQVYYSRFTALALHLAPLVAVIVAPLLTSDRTSGVTGIIGRYTAMMYGIVQGAATWLLAIGFAVGTAVLRVALSGRPLTWLSRPSIGVAMYAPPALLGIVLIQSLRAPGRISRDPAKQRTSAFTGHWGSGVGFNALLAAVLILKGFGASYVFALWAIVLLPGLYLATRAGGFSTISGVANYVMLASAPLAQSFYLAATLGTFVAQKIGASGNWPDPIGSYIGDLVLSAITGLHVALIASPLAPVLREWFANKRVIRALVCLTLIGSVVGSCCFPYSPKVLKRLAIQHTLWTNGTDDVIDREYAMLTFDPLAPTYVFDRSAEFRDHFQSAKFQKELQERPRPNTWLGLYPLSEMVHRDVSLPDRSTRPPSAAQQKPFPEVRVVSSEEVQPIRRRIHLEIDNGGLGHAWRTINVTGPIVGWSLAGSSLPDPEQRSGAPVAYHCKHAGGPGTDIWRFWIEAEGSDAVRIDLAVLQLDLTPELDNARRVLPDWVDFVGLTSYISTWQV